MDGYITIGTELDTKEFDKQIAQLEKQLTEMEKDYRRALKAGAKVDDAPMRKLAADTEKAKNKLVGLYQQKMKLESSGGFNNMNKSLGDMIKKAGKLALGIFGIRSAYMALRRASADLASYDQQYATNLEYIRYVLTQTIAPVLRWIVNTVGTILQYLYAILNAWFGIGAKLNLSAESFNKMKKSASGVSGAVKEIKKDLLGFDEINRLTDQSSTGTSAGAGGVGIPDFEIGGLSEIPRWLQWIMDNKDIVLGILGTIAGIFAAIKIADFVSSLGNLFAIFGKLSPAVKTLLTSFKDLSALQIAGVFAGITIAIIGLIKTITALIDFIQDPSWKNFISVLDGISVALAGVGVAMVALNMSNPIGWILLAVAAIAKLITILGEDKAQILDVVEAQNMLKEAMEETRRATDRYINAVENAEEAERNLANMEKKHKISGEELQQQVENGILTYKEMNDAQREVYKAYIANKNAQEDLITATEDLSNAKHNEALMNEEVSLSVANETQKYDELKESTLQMLEEGKISVEDAQKVFERAMADMSDSARQTFMKDLPDSIKNGLDPDKYSNFFQKFKNAWNNFWNNLKNTFNFKVNLEGSRRKFYRTAEENGGRWRSALVVEQKAVYFIQA